MNIDNYLNWIFTRFRSKNPSKFFASQDRSLQSEPIPTPAVVFHWGQNATVDYFFRQPTVLGHPIVHHVDIKPGELTSSDNPCQLWIVVRYLSDQLLERLLRHKRLGGRVVFFMDDDLPHNLFDGHLPLAYRRMLWQRFGRFLSQIEALADEIWVSTPVLAERYAHAQPRLIPVAGYETAAPKDLVSYFYHGSPSTHREEIKWLQSVVSRTQASCSNTLFMIVGDKQVRQLFGDIPRVLILHPIPWPTYRDALGALPHHIGLAPLKTTALNAHRSPTRFYDFTRLGAAGLFCDVPPYRGFVRNNVDGWLLPSEPTIWSNKIIELAQDADLRQQVLSAAQARISEEKTK